MALEYWTHRLGTTSTDRKAPHDKKIMDKDFWSLVASSVTSQLLDDSHA